MENLWNKKLDLHGVIIVAIIAIIIFAFLSIYLEMENKKLETAINNTYDKSFYELTEYVDNVEALLAKAEITSTPIYMAKTLTNIWRKADLAQASLSQIPIENNVLEVAVKFFNQLSDYSYSLSNKLIDGEEIKEEDYKNLEKYYLACKTLNETLQNLASDVMSETLSWKDLSKKDSGAFWSPEVENFTKDSFSKIEEDMQDYEGLIYDGPFSEHMTSVTPLGLGDKEINSGDAEKIVYDFLNSGEIKSVKYNGTVEGNIIAFDFEFIKNDENLGRINITKQGGKVLWMNIYREVGESMIDKKYASGLAKKYLEDHGFSNMKESYYTDENGILTINYAYNQNGIICYPDLIKVKVALDNGEVLGLETMSYLNSHHTREIPIVNISMQEARQKLNSKLEVITEQVAVIPTDWRTELTVYEFRCKAIDREFIIYINVENGKEEKIFLLLDTPGGTFTV